MYTLKDLSLVKLITGFYNKSELKRLMYCCDEEIRERVVREQLPIPLKYQNEIVALMKPIEFEIQNWIMDHNGIFTVEQEWALEFYWDSDGTINRIKTADSLIRSKSLNEKTRFVVACQYLSSWGVFIFFENLHELARKNILDEYSMENKNRNDLEKNVEKWIGKYRKGSITKSHSYRWEFRGFIWTHVSLQSRLLDDVSSEHRESLLVDAFENTNKIHIGRFCLSRMSADHHEEMLTLYPPKVLRIYLFWPNQKFFLDIANRVWIHLTGKHFMCVLHIIICQKIVALWKDIDYEDLLRQFWQKSPDHFKETVGGTEIFEILGEIINHRFPQDKVPGYFLLHERDVYENAISCKEITNILF